MSQVTTKSRPIIMSPKSVHAILDGRKSVTRRVIGRVVGFGAKPVRQFGRSDTPGYDWCFKPVSGRNRSACWNDLRHSRLLAACPHGVVGDQFWVREKWRTEELDETMVDGIRFSCGEFVAIENTRDAADAWVAAHDNGRHGWRSPIHMPRWASRLTLCITDVRIERVQDINEEDAQAEGVEPERETTVVVHGTRTHLGIEGYGRLEPDNLHRVGFARAWDALNAKRGFGWDTNPWVWIVAFAKVPPDPA